MTKNPQQWKDEKGNNVPAKYVPKFDKLKTYRANKLAKEAKQLQKRIIDFKQRFKEITDEVFEEFVKQYEIERTDHKGNFTFKTFDGRIKVEVDVNDLIRFEDEKIQAAHEKLKQFLDNAMGDEENFLRELVNDAFETSNGQLDARRVLHLTKYRKQIKGKKNSRLYNEAMDLLEEAITRPDSKKYMRIYEKDEDGQFQPIVLNFSAL